MKNILLIFSLACLITSCSSTKKTTASSSSAPTTDTVSVAPGERDGSSFAKAIIINEKSESKGVDAEYAWLRKNFPGYRSKGQSLTYNNKKPFDVIHIVTGDGKDTDVYFDISNFFGKF